MLPTLLRAGSRMPPSLLRLLVKGRPPSLLRLPVQLLKFCQPVPVVLPYMLNSPVQTVKKIPRVIQDLPLMETSGTVPQTSPGMNQLTRNCLKSLSTERLSEARGRLWASIRSLSLTLCLLQMTALLPVPESSPPGKSL